MTETQPRNVRLSRSVLTRLANRAARSPGMKASAIAALMIDEGLRMEEHPGVLFRDGSVGRRAVLVSGPDVWEVIRSVRSARTAEPELNEQEILALVSTNTGVAEKLLRTAVEYWAAYPAEIDERITRANLSESEHLDEWNRAQQLLTG